MCLLAILGLFLYFFEFGWECMGFLGDFFWWLLFFLWVLGILYITYLYYIYWLYSMYFIYSWYNMVIYLFFILKGWLVCRSIILRLMRS